MEEFVGAFRYENNGYAFPSNALFGYTAYDANRYFEGIDVSDKKDEYNIPEILYRVYRYVLVVNHFKNELYVFEHSLKGESPRGLEEILSLVHNKNLPEYSFSARDDESSNMTDGDFIAMVEKCKEHCYRGDVFQIVPSRRFSRSYRGDDFNLYRMLRSINPSPYLFYFDYGNFKIMGSSPEAELVVKKGVAEIHPIAGTFRRTGDDEKDAQAAHALLDDPKETAEHVMLVDLARNDLSRGCRDVKVENYKQLQFFSHVIHLVSKVSGRLREGQSSVRLLADTFPAGTLSGAPKVEAMRLISRYEPTRRGFYGGAIGILGFDGSVNHAIMIRSFLCKDNTLYYQAGAGIVSKSDPQSELQEVKNKLGALRSALVEASENR